MAHLRRSKTQSVLLRRPSSMSVDATRSLSRRSSFLSLNQKRRDDLKSAAVSPIPGPGL